MLLYQDVFINVVGGLQLREPAADVAIAVAICSRFSAFYLSKSNEEKHMSMFIHSYPVLMQQ